MSRYVLPVGLLLALPALAQTSPSTATIVVTGNPLGRDTLAQPASVLSGEALADRRAATLGETLDGLPGVASTAFGPNVGRPVIRGLDGDRVRLLDNGAGVVDASNLSFDHAVPIDPLAVERIEVLRGPAALLYGGNATGGAVNTIDNRIPRAPVAGFSGRAELCAGGAASERAGAVLVEGGAGGFAWHADASGHGSDDLRVPGGRVFNSAADGGAAAVGVSRADADGYAGIAVDGYRNRYGIVAEPDVFIRMKRDRVALAAERRNLAGPIEAFDLKASSTDYQHEEVEGDGSVGTTFKSQGSDLRLLLRHKPLGGFSGAFGVQFDKLDFSALGEEAFVPSTRTRSQALFALESVTLAGTTLSAGLRGERVRVGTDAEERRFTPASATLGATGALGAPGSGFGWSASLGHTERAPAYYELFADGLHVATGAYERGDPTLGVERSRHAEAGVGWRGDKAQVRLDVFSTRFSLYLALYATGATVDVDGEPVPEYAFRAVRARLSGVELEGRWELPMAGWQLAFTGSADLVRGTNADSGEPLARLAPLRVRGGVEASAGAWRWGAAVRHAATQDRVPATDTATPGWTMLDLWAAWQPLPSLQLALKLGNATDRRATSATTVATLRDLAPLPGRSLAASARVSF